MEYVSKMKLVPERFYFKCKILLDYKGNCQCNFKRDISVLRCFDNCYTVRQKGFFSGEVNFEDCFIFLKFEMAQQLPKLMKAVKCYKKSKFLLFSYNVIL